MAEERFIAGFDILGGTDKSILDGLRQLSTELKVISRAADNARKVLNQALGGVAGGGAAAQKSVQGVATSLNAAASGARNLSKAQKELGATLDSTAAKGNTFASRFKTALGIGAGVGAVVLGIRAIGRELKELVKDSIDTAAEFQKLSTSFTAILAQPLSEQGVSLTPELISDLRQESKRLFQEAQFAAIQTVATTKEYTQLLQTSLAVGQQVGLTQEQIEQITKRLVLAAGAFGIEITELGSSIGQIFTGTIRVTNQLGRSLGLTTKEQREQLKLAIQQGTLFDFLEKKTRAFGATATEVANNFVNVKAAVQDIFEVGGTAAIQPIFRFLNQTLIQFRDAFIGATENELFKPALTRIVNQIRDTFVEILPSLRSLVRELINLASAFGDAFFRGGGAAINLIIKGLLIILRIVQDIVSGRGLLGLLIPLGLARLAINAIAGTFTKVNSAIRGVTSTSGAMSIAFLTAARSAGLIDSQLRKVELRAAAIRAIQGGNFNIVPIPTGVPGSVLRSTQTAANAATLKALQAPTVGLGTALATTASKLASFLGTLGLVVGIGGIVIEVISELTGRSESLRKAQEKATQSSQDFADSLQKVAEQTVFLSLIKELDELSKKSNKTAEDLNRINEIKQLLGDAGVLGPFVAKLIEQQGITKETLELTRQLHEEESIKLKDQIAGLEKAIALSKQIEGAGQTVGELEFPANPEADKNLIELRNTLANTAPKLLELIKAFQLGAITSEDLSKKLEDAKASLEGLAQTNDAAASSVFDLASRFSALSVEINNLKAQQDAKNLSDIQAEIIDRRLKTAGEERILVGRQLDEVTNGLVKSNKALAKSELEAALATAKAKQIQIEAGIAASKQAVLNAEANLKEAFSTAALVDLAFARRNLTNSQEALAVSQKTIADLEARIKNLGKIAAPGAGTGKKGGKRERDELADFLKEVERQLGIAKKLADQIEKEVDRVTNSRRKLLSELRQSGALPFEQSIALEKNLILESARLGADLANAQRELVDANAQLAKAIAARTQARRDKKDKTGTDNRDAELEGITRLADNKLELVFQAFERFRKAEEDLTQLTREQINNRLTIRQKELDAIKELVDAQASSLQKLIEIQERFGLISSETALRAGLSITQGGIEQRRKALLQRLFPFADPDINATVRKAFIGFSELVKKTTTDRDFGGFKIVSTDLDFLNKVSEETKNVLSNLNNAIASQDPDKLNKVRDAFSSFLNTTLRGGDKTTLQNLLNLGKQFGELTKNLEAVDRAIAGQQKGKTDTGLAEKRKQVESQIENIREQAQRLLGIDQRDVKALTDKLELLSKINGINEVINKTSLNQEQVIEATVELEKLKLEEEEALRDFAVELHDLAVAQLDIQAEFVNFDLQRLDTVIQLVQQQKELGTIGQLEARRTEESLLKQKQTQLEILKAVLQQKLAIETANLIRSTGINDPRLAAAANPQAAQRQLAVQSELNQVVVQTQAVRDALFDLRSPLIAARDGFRQIGEAVGGLPAPFNELKGVFDGLAALADFFAKKGRPKTPAKELEDSITTASATIQKAGSDFRLNLETSSDTVNSTIELLDEAGKKLHQEIIDAAKEFRGIVTGKNTSETVNPIKDAGKAIQDAAQKAGNVLLDNAHEAGHAVETGGKSFLQILRENLPGIIQGIAGAAASIISGISQGGPGGIISGVGGALGAISGLAPALSFLGPVGAVAGIVGGFVSFFGARARKKTEEMAKAIQAGIDDLKKKIASGAVSLGEGIRQLDLKLADARRRLSGRKKGGREKLAEIEADVREEQERLRQEAKELQADFRKQLALLKQPEGLRGIITQIQEAFEQAKKFIKSFENPDDLAQATKEAMEFLELTFKELKDAIKKELADLNKQLKENAEDFEKSQRDILLRGRIDPRISEAESKRSDLIRLERDFRLKQKELQDQIKIEQEKLRFVEKREKLEQKIGRVAEKAANELRKAADAIAKAAGDFERILKLIQQFGILGGLGRAKDLGLTLTLQLQTEQGVTTHRIGVDPNKHAVIRGSVTPSGLFQFNPVTG